MGRFDIGGEVLMSVPFSMPMDEFLAKGAILYNGQLVFEQLPFNQPLYILYSSGTSGPPKCIVHSQGVRQHATIGLRKKC